MRPARPLQRYCSAAILTLLFTALSAFSAVQHRAKNDGTSLYRSHLLEPPPVAVLSEGDVVELLSKGADASMVRTEGGIKGWVRNEDLVAVRLADSQTHKLKEQGIKGGGEFRGSIDIDIPPPAKVTVEEIYRSFADEVVETVDREQLEMRHDEN